MMRHIFLACTLSACSTTDPTDSKTPESEYSWPGGTFEFATTSVVDDCMAGGAEDLFFLDDDETLNPWAHPIFIPSWEDLAEPEVALVELSAPFTSTELTMKRGPADGQVVARGIRQDNVIAGLEDKPECVVDLVIDVLVTLDAPDNVRGTATLMVDDPSGEDTCPPLVVPCEVSVEFAGLRAD